MRTCYTVIALCCLIAVMPLFSFAQGDWPKSITTRDGKLVKVYQWQPESFSNGVLQANAAISVTEKSGGDPSFGMVWLTASTVSNGSQVTIGKVEIDEIKLPDGGNGLAALQADITNGLSNQRISIAKSEIDNALQMNQEEQNVANQINNTPPKIIYSDKPSLLIVIDGAPRLQQNSRWGMETVVNTPFTIIKNSNKFYLYGGKHWYVASSATGPFAITTSVPSELERLRSEIVQANKDNNTTQEENDYVISNIIVTTEPAELLQSDGEPNFSPIPQTDLLYVRNSNNDIFMDVNSQQYYILLSGRWYKSQTLSGKWNYVASDKLPADFAKIPEGSPKDNVLPSVAGTLAAKDAVMNARVPQTARVDRKNVQADIQYDGEPRFNAIEGTEMSYAINTPDYVIRWRGIYYAVDNGVWFQSYFPNGPWVVSTVRPYAVSLIPPSYPVYAMKYVYIYDITPDYIYMGYTPGYLNTFIYGPTVVYGTGYYYRPWYGRYYYPRPYTWGFNMHYNPWTGWGFGFNYNMGWFHLGVGNYSPWGWWGPAVYRPAYFHTPYYGGYAHGYYGATGARYYNGRQTVVVNNINIYHNNNIYNNRRDVVTRDNRRPVSYNRNTQSAPVRTFNNNSNPRPSPRDAGRTVNNNARPTERIPGQRPNTSPRVSEQNPGRPLNSNNTRPADRGSAGQGTVAPRNSTRQLPSNSTPANQRNTNPGNQRSSNPNPSRPSGNLRQAPAAPPDSRTIPGSNLNPAAGTSQRSSNSLPAERRGSSTPASSPAVNRSPQVNSSPATQQRPAVAPQRRTMQATGQAPNRSIETPRPSAPQREIRSPNSRVTSLSTGTSRSSVSRGARTGRE